MQYYGPSFMKLLIKNIYWKI